MTSHEQLIMAQAIISIVAAIKCSLETIFVKVSCSLADNPRIGGGVGGSLGGRDPVRNRYSRDVTSNGGQRLRHSRCALFRL